MLLKSSLLDRYMDVSVNSLGQYWHQQIHRNTGDHNETEDISVSV
jgi:hypothetical protein